MSSTRKIITRIPKSGAPVNVGLIGTGSIARVHAAAWAASGIARVGAVFDIDTGKARSFAEKNCPNAKVLATADDFLARAEIDLVDVCTSEPAHAATAIPAVHSGKRVLCEKLLAHTMDAGASMMAAAGAAKYEPWIQYNYRFFPGIRILREITDGNTHGPLKQMQVTCGAHCFNHLLDSALWLMGGELEEISASGRLARDPSDQLGVAADIAYIPHGMLVSVRLSGGRLLGFHVTRFPEPFAPAKIPFHIVALFEREAMELTSLGWNGDMRGCLRQLPDGPNLLADQPTASSQDGSFNPALAAVARAVAGDHTSLATWQDGWRVMLASHAACLSVESGKSVSCAGLADRWQKRIGKIAR